MIQKSIIALSFAFQYLLLYRYILSSFQGAPFSGNGILAPYIFRSNDKNFKKSTIDICFVVCILVFTPQLYIELILGSSIFGQWDIGSGAMTKNFRSLRLIFALSFVFQYLLPRYILSSRRELHFWAMGFWLLKYSGAMTKNFRSLQSIFALWFAFQYLLYFWTLRYWLRTYSGAMIQNFISLKSIFALLFAFQYLLPRSFVQNFYSQLLFENFHPNFCSPI